MFNRLITYWVYGGFLAGLLLLLLAPLAVHSFPPLLLLIFLHLPAYMLHQYEEHDNDRFRQFANRLIGPGRRGLSLPAVFVINIFGVWGMIALSLYLAATVTIGFGLLAVYLVLVNALVHIAHVILLRTYNPGLATSLALFLPLGSYTLLQIQDSGLATPGMHVFCLTVSVGLHAAIVFYALRPVTKDAGTLPQK